MELRHLRYFYETAVEMNFTRAAEKLNIAQPPLSKQIKDLEEELGVSLFVRRPHYLALTPEGEMLKQYAAQILGLADKAASTIREIGQGLNGTIYIDTVEGRTLRELSGWISQFSDRYPSVQYSVWTGGADDIVIRVKNGLCDIAIVQDTPTYDGLESYRLYQESWTAIIPQDCPLADDPGDTVTTKELLPYHLIIPTRAMRLAEINNWYRDSEDKPKIRCKYSNLLTGYELARQSVGIAILPAQANDIVGSRTSNRVILKRIIEPSSKSSFYLIYNKNRVQPNVVREFIAFIKKQSREAKSE